MAMSPDSNATGKLLEELDARERDLRERIAERRDAHEPGAEALNPAGDVDDKAFDRSLAEVEQDLTERSLRELEEIALVRARVSSGTYGECADCGAAIAPARLEVNPTAVRCAACQTSRETGAGPA